jgi:4-hydroxy-2-oxoheptanedioate aldolase
VRNGRLPQRHRRDRQAGRHRRHLRRAFDLSAALGRPGDFANPEHVAAISRVQRACQEAGKASFIYSPTVEDAKNRIRQGFDSVTYSMDALLLIDA